MTQKIFKLMALALVVLINFASCAQAIKEPKNINPQWSQPYQPFRIVGNVYYVGSYNLACYLIVTPTGNILINTGLAASASMIQENIEALGFKFADTKILLTTQAHYDHVGAMAAIQKLTGAKMMADDKDAGVLSDGGNSDYAFGNSGSTFEPVKVDRLLKDGDTITLDNMKIVMLHHPGHTKGSCSYIFNVKDEHKVYKVLIANMPTIVTDKKFNEIPSYPEIANDYSYTLEAMTNLSFDIWISSHEGQFGLHAKHKPGDAYRPEAFEDRKGYEKSINELKAAYLQKISQK